MSMDVNSASYVALVPLVLGGIFSYFKPYVGNKDKFNELCEKSLKITSEKIANELATLINQTVHFDAMPRGDGGFQTPDFCANIASAISRHQEYGFREANRQLWLNCCETVLIGCTVISLICFLISIFYSSLISPLILILGVIALIEVSAIIGTRKIFNGSKQDARLLP